MDGSIGILNVGAGDTKLSFDKDKPEERKRAAAAVAEMLKLGFAILVQVGEKDGKPLFMRADAFDPDTCEYIIVGTPPEEIDIPGKRVEQAESPRTGLDDGPKLKEPKRRGRPPKVRVPAERTRAVSVARSAGGLLVADDAELAERQMLDKLESFDNFAGLRNMLREISQKRGDWAGIPMPMEGQRLVVEPRFPKADEIKLVDEMVNPPRKPTELEEKATLRNVFWSWTRRAHIAVWEVDGKIEFGQTSYPHQMDMLIDTLRASDAWGIEQEGRAVQLLGTLLRHHMFKAYLLTGMFIESSPRSGVTYLFRKLRPTIAISDRGRNGQRGEHMRMLCALCLHPIAYYSHSWAGAMCPTDDVVAHLMLMRADEHLFWKRANQHPPYAHEAGL